MDKVVPLRPELEKRKDADKMVEHSDNILMLIERLRFEITEIKEEASTKKVDISELSEMVGNAKLTNILILKILLPMEKLCNAKTSPTG